MACITATVHITAPTARPLPSLDGQNPLTPSIDLSRAVNFTTRQDALSNLADGMDAVRDNINRVLTAWKDHLGKEDGSSAALNDEDNDEPEIQEEE